MRLAGAVDVISVMPLAGDESLVLLAAHGGAHSGRAHRISLPGTYRAADWLFGSFVRPVRGALSCAHGAGPGGYRLDNVVITGAAAEIALEFLANRMLVEVVALAVHHVDRCHDHSGRAKSALQAVVLAKCF